MNTKKEAALAILILTAALAGPATTANTDAAAVDANMANGGAR